MSNHQKLTKFSLIKLLVLLVILAAGTMHRNSHLDGTAALIPVLSATSAAQDNAAPVTASAEEMPAMRMVKMAN